jgi:CCR4-NOT transcription complex subunit 3
MREKFEVELKKEIKKLQRIRDFMRIVINNPDIKDKSRFQEARKRIEVVSEDQFNLCCSLRMSAVGNGEV